MSETVKYTQTGVELAYPRVEWKCECGFRLCIIEGYNMNWESDNYGKLVYPKGKCMKCKCEIS